MVYLLRALDFWRIVREVLVDVEVEVECAAFVHALVGLYREDEVEDVIRVGERGFHCRAEGEFGEICETVERGISKMYKFSRQSSSIGGRSYLFVPAAEQP